MTRAAARRGGRLWPVVLVVCALTLALTGWRLADPPTAGADAAPASSLAAPSPRPIPTPTARSSATTRPTRTWPTHPATGVPAARVVAPQELRIPALDLTMPVVGTTVDEHGLMALPDRPTQIGWYAYGPAPGSARGTAVLGGHVDSDRFGTGPLVALASLRPGATVTVATGKRTLDYEVVAVQRISKRALDPAEVFDRDGAPLLRILTCGGVYDPDRGGYQDNVVVTARPR